MEEVDSIIIGSLKEIGCDFEDDIKLKNLSPEEIYKSISTLCKIIRPEIEISKQLPVQMAQRFAAASQLVDACKSIGFNGDLGYQTILYSNINELRRVFMWLIEHLPKSEDKTDYQHVRTVSKSQRIENEIARQLARELKKPWLTSFLQKPSAVPFIPTDLVVPKLEIDSIDMSEYEDKVLLPIFHQTKNLIPSIIHSHDVSLWKKVKPDSKDIAKKLRSSMIKSTQSLNLVPSTSRSTLSSHSNAPINEDKMSEENESQKVPKTQLETLSEKVEILKDQIAEQEDIYRQLTLDRDEQLRNIEIEQKNLEESKADGKLKMQVAMLLDNPDESIEKLKQTLEATMNNRKNLIAKFEAHKIPMEQELDSYSTTNSSKLQKMSYSRNKIKEIKETMSEIHGDLNHKIQLQHHLQEELSKIKRTTERSAYTSRIADIINSIKKQNNDINDVLKDTRVLQKAINNIEGQLQRQFTVTEELVWTKTAKQDEYSKRAYKLLISLHTEFSELISLIKNTGSVQREIRELEDQIDNERQQNVQQKIDQITRDLQMIQGVDDGNK